MKLTRDVRKRAKKFYRYCSADGRVDETKLRAVINFLASAKPRNYIGIMERLKNLVEIEITGRSIEVQSALELPDQGTALFAEVERRYGPALRKTYKVKPELIGGLRIQRGSDVWDGTIKERLNRLQQTLN